MPKLILDPGHKPAALYNKEFRAKANRPLFLALEREDGLVYRYETAVVSGDFAESRYYTERLVKTLLWAVGGFKITVGGDEKIGAYIKDCYRPGGARAFDADFMSRIYEQPFEVVVTDLESVPAPSERPVSIGRHLEGYRIGFDAGGSDMKVSAVVNGEVIHAEEIVWHPKLNASSDYHYEWIRRAIRAGAEKMERVDAIGVSSAGVYVQNRAMAASLFIKVPPEEFNEKIKDIYVNIAAELGVPLVVANDGDVAALSGSMFLKKNGILGIAMGTSEAGGYVDKNGSITGWLNELAFVPVDYRPDVARDEWSGDFGCGVKYFSQDAVIRLAPAAGIAVSENLSLAEKLKEIQALAEKGHGKARQIFETIGGYFGYAIAHYADIYDINYIQVLGRVTSGIGGDLIIQEANRVLAEEFPELAEKITLYIPDEYERRVGQSIAAASLPAI